MFNVSQIAKNLKCFYCHKPNITKIWPIAGDYTPLYFQESKGEYMVTMNCPHCGKEWYIVWDFNPGEFRQLDG